MSLKIILKMFNKYLIKFILLLEIFVYNFKVFYLQYFIQKIFTFFASFSALALNLSSFFFFSAFSDFCLLLSILSLLLNNWNFLEEVFNESKSVLFSLVMPEASLADIRRLFLCTTVFDVAGLTLAERPGFIELFNVCLWEGDWSFIGVVDFVYDAYLEEINL